MRTSTHPAWFRVAVQALVMIAESEQACPSTSIAQGVDAHAVFLRRVLAQLARHKLVVAREGRDGGYRLARAATRVTLADVYLAVQCASVSDDTMPTRCGIGRIHDALDLIDAEIEQQAIERLRQVTIASLCQVVRHPVSEAG